MKKISWILFLVAFTFVIFYIKTSSVKENKNSVNQGGNVSPTLTPDVTDDKKVVFELMDKYYKFYDSCMKAPPAEAKGRVGEYCQENSGLTTINFANNLEKGGTAKAGADPIVCAQEPPESTTVNPDITINDIKASGFVVEKFGPTEVSLELMMIKDGGIWKIDNIICPAP